ncbi:MAG: DUF2924 domain-containing protein [Pseudomonadota bacterium]
MPGNAHPERDLLRAEWEAAIGSPPPPFLSVRIMTKAMAYEAQCRTHGGLSAQVRRRLERIASGEVRAQAVASPVSIRPGAHLVRDWNGRTYQVEVLENGYRMDGRTWTSLSALARHITGANWSGPRFFGLTRRGASLE